MTKFAEVGQTGIVVGNLLVAVRCLEAVEHKTAAVVQLELGVFAVDFEDVELSIGGGNQNNFLIWADFGGGNWGLEVDDIG